MTALFKDNAILVTGACGTVGTELVKQLLASPLYAPDEVIGIDNNESQLFLSVQYVNIGKSISISGMVNIGSGHANRLNHLIKRQ